MWARWAFSSVALHRERGRILNLWEGCRPREERDGKERKREREDGEREGERGDRDRKRDRRDENGHAPSERKPDRVRPITASPLRAVPSTSSPACHPTSRLQAC